MLSHEILSVNGAASARCVEIELVETLSSATLASALDASLCSVALTLSLTQRTFEAAVEST